MNTTWQSGLEYIQELDNGTLQMPTGSPPSEVRYSDSDSLNGNNTGSLETETRDSQILAEPGDDDAPVTPLTPAKRGHWFPKQAYSKLYFSFETNQPGPISYIIHLEIEQDQDSYPRYLTLSLDGEPFAENIWIDEDGYHTSTGTPVIYGVGEHTITITINYGAHAEKGWLLKHFWVYDLDGNPLDVTGQFTHKEGHCNLRYLVEMGPDTTLNLAIENGWETHTRICDIYVDDTFITSRTVPANLEIDLGDYIDSSVHELRLDIYWQGYTECGKKITILQVHHRGAFIELDYRSDHKPDDAFISYFESYYKCYSYHRVDIRVDESLAFSDTLHPPEISALHDNHFQHKKQYTQQAGNIDWLWCLFAHYIWESGGYYGGDSIVFPDQAWKDWCFWNWRDISSARRTVLMHEFGHYLGMPHYYDNTDCPCPDCCYAHRLDCIDSDPTYCVWHWQRGAYYESIWHDVCNSTSGWTRKGPGSGFEGYRTLQDSGTLHTKKDYLYCTQIAGTSSWKHGPLFVKELHTSVEIQDIRSLQAKMQLIDGNTMGDVIITLFDTNKERSIVFCLYDSWYGSVSRSYFDYSKAGDEHDNWYEGEHYGNFTATWLFGCNPESITFLTSELDDGTPKTHTHYSGNEFNPERKIKYIGIQFARARYYNYHGHLGRVLDLVIRYHFDRPGISPLVCAANDESDTVNMQSSPLSETDWKLHPSIDSDYFSSSSPFSLHIRSIMTLPQVSKWSHVNSNQNIQRTMH
ncbi:MAG: hypothetical protein GF309_15965 [Candidatus Lokiarchaeota archaeon]|nr:hypothetical protein [Candidatus Lokiarchaeota archaeon]